MCQIEYNCLIGDPPKGRKSKNCRFHSLQIWTLSWLSMSLESGREVCIDLRPTLPTGPFSCPRRLFTYLCRDPSVEGGLPSS